MVTRLLYETPVLALSHDDAADWLYVAWRGKPTLDDIRQGCAWILEGLHESGTEKILCDATLVEAPAPDGLQWAATEWLPVALEAGLRYVAWVYPAYFLVGRDIFDRLQAGITQPVVAAFDDVASAYSWLQQPPTVTVVDPPVLPA